MTDSWALWGDGIPGSQQDRPQSAMLSREDVVEVPS